MARRVIAPRAFLAALPMFKALDEATLARLATATSARRLVRGERLFSKGDAATAMYVVVHGEIRLVERSPARGDRLTRVVGAGHSRERIVGVDADQQGRVRASVGRCCGWRGQVGPRLTKGQ